jgi:type IV secretion system protein TrbI
MSDEKQIPEIQAAAPPSPALRDKRVLPEGVVPKQAQGYVMAGLAVLILMAVMFSKNHAKPATKTADTGPLAMSTDMNQRKIQELEQDLSADQRQSQQQTMAQKNMGTDAAPSGAPSAMQPNGTAASMATLPPPAAPPSDPVADAEKALAFKSRFASNLVSADDGAPRPSVDSSDVTEAPAVRSASLPQAPAAQATPASAAGSRRAPEVNVNSAHGQPYVVLRGYKHRHRAGQSA